MNLKRVCVYCGSSPGRDAAFGQAAERFGVALADRDIALVYGGGSVGLMGRLADTVLARGGHVIGVIPAALIRWEVAHLDLPDLHVVASMHERKAKMAELSDAFVALPGGMGTLDEMCEMLTWGQLGLHCKPCGFLDVAGYFQPLLAFFDHAVEHRFVKPEHRAMFIVDDDPHRMLDRLSTFEAPPAEKWQDRANS
jgi:uncharacterized protein (TIGR00730 family)